MTLSFIANPLGRRLRVGDRVRLQGGFDMEPKWLNGQTAYFGHCVGFLPGENGQATALIQLETPVTFDTVTGTFVAMSFRYESARWAMQEVVHLELFSSQPSSLKDPSTRGLWLESHASYRIEVTNNSSKPNPLGGSA